MSKRAYFAQVEEWRKKYGVKPALNFNGDPTAIKAGCARCAKVRRKMSRHHKANDFLFARLLPDEYAPRYVQFHPEDIDRLCDQCHRSWHKSSAFDKVYRACMLSLSINNRVVSKEWCERWRNKFLDAYNEWMAKPYRSRSTRKRETKNAKRRKRRRKSVRKSRSQGRSPKGSTS